MTRNDRVLVLPIGIPGSGKTFWSKASKLPCVSSDDIREELYGDASIQGSFKEVFDLYYKRINTILDTVGICIGDATNITRWARETAIFRTHPTKVVYVIMNNDLDRALRNNANRSRVCPERVIRRMYRQLQNEPPCNDSFKEICEIQYVKD